MPLQPCFGMIGNKALSPSKRDKSKQLRVNSTLSFGRILTDTHDALAEQKIHYMDIKRSIPPRHTNNWCKQLQQK